MSSESTLSPLQTFFNVIWIYLRSSKAQNTRAKEMNRSLLKQASENCEHKHHVINGSSVPWILNILVALINQSQKCHYRKNSLLLYFFFHPISFRDSVVLAASRLQKYHFRFIWVYYIEKEIIVRSVLPFSCLPSLQWLADDKWHRIISMVKDTSKLRIQIYNTKTQVFAFPLCTLC